MTNGHSKFGADQVESFLIGKGFSGPFSISTLHGGYWNQVMKVGWSGGTLVLKRYAEVLPNSLFPNLPEAEAAALTRLEGLNVAPEPRGFWPEDKILLYSFVEGSLWSDDLDAVAAMLIRKERADPAGFRSVPWLPDGILKQGDGLLARCSEHGHAERLRRVRPGPLDIAPPARLSLIHTDIGPGNLVGRGGELRLIDWQCPAEGDVTEDIYSFLSPAFQILSDRPPLTDENVDAFFKALARPTLRDRYFRLRPLYAFRMAAYCCLRAQGADDDKALHDRYFAATAAEIEHVEQAS